MSARLVRDVPGWQYPGGSCHLRVWDHPEEGLVAILHEPAWGNGVSVANAMEPILSQLAAEHSGSRPLVVQHTDAGMVAGAEWHNVIERNGWVEWSGSSARDQAEELGVTVAELVPEGMTDW